MIVRNKSGEGAEMPENVPTASLPLSIIAGQTVNPGDVIQLRVVSADGETIVVAYDHPADETPAGSDELAEEFEGE